MIIKIKNIQENERCIRNKHSIFQSWTETFKWQIKAINYKLFFVIIIARFIMRPQSSTSKLFHTKNTFNNKMSNS